ncbi:hypothetical protein INT46_008969 [Mucor plumbeus]|uniref:Uncharacterized protein n=1 Tax=Mucor plumbeus TaxID=97098 RepID=A0A8H7UR16_9FUNG|nr:hypothetical protein INT46_008969 [Mucor plumbeus]
MSRIQQGIAKEHPEWVLPRLCQKNANKTGVYAAIFFGVITLPIARRFGLDKNRALFSALGTSGIAGYITAKYTYAHCERTYGFFQGMEHIQTEELRKKKEDNQNDSEIH